MSINNRLKIHRNEIGLSQEKYGITLGLSEGYAQKYIARYEDKTTLPDSLISEFAKKYPDKLVWLLTGKEENRLELKEKTLDNLCAIMAKVNEMEFEIKELQKNNNFLTKELRETKEKLVAQSQEAGAKTLHHTTSDRNQGASTGRAGGGPIPDRH